MKRTQFAAGLLLALCALLVFAQSLWAQGTQLQNRSLMLSNALAAATSRYKFSLQMPGMDTVQTIVFQICANDPFPESPCTPPAGLDASQAVLLSQSGEMGFVMSPQTTTNQIVIMRPPLAASQQLSTYEFDGVRNPDAEGSYYVRVLTYQDGNLSGVPSYTGGIAYAINMDISIKATVPPYLLMCVGVTITGYDCNNVQGDYVNFGELSSRITSQGTSQILAASNAISGYSIYVGGTTMTSGNNVIPALTGASPVQTGTGQFGINLRANSAPQGGQDVSGTGFGLPTASYNQINKFAFNPGDAIAVTTQPDEARKYTVTYVVNVPAGQAPGVYVSTMSYVALGTF